MYNSDTVCMTLRIMFAIDLSLQRYSIPYYLAISYLGKLLNIFNSEASFVNQRTWT